MSDDIFGGLVKTDGGAPSLTVEAIAEAYRLLRAQVPPPEGYIVTWRMSVRTYRLLWNLQKPMRKKIARMRRKCS